MPFHPALIPSTLRPIADKVQAGQRISDEDAVLLYRSNELNAIGAIANIIRERKNGNVATYILNRYINYSNICILSCQFCAFGAREGVTLEAFGWLLVQTGDGRDFERANAVGPAQLRSLVLEAEQRRRR